MSEEFLLKIKNMALVIKSECDSLGTVRIKSNKIVALSDLILGFCEQIEILKKCKKLLKDRIIIKNNIMNKIERKDGKIFIDGVEYAEVKNTIAEQVVEKWEPQGGQHTIDLTMSEPVLYSYFTDSSREAGIEYKTKKQAEKVAKEMTFHNRMLAYREEFCPDYEPDWSDLDEEKWYIFYNYSSDNFTQYSELSIQNIGQVYFPEKECKELVKKLNSGEVEF